MREVMRPSPINRSSAGRATSRRTGSKHETVTASGLSMITSTPVACSKARMFRPSRPMILPLISSFGSVTSRSVVSAVWSDAIRPDRDRDDLLRLAAARGAPGP
jgi:hypothetical protein